MAAQHNNNHGNGNHHGGGGNGNGGTTAGSGSAPQPASQAQAAPGLPAWLTAGGGGSAPIAVWQWLDPNYPGGYTAWYYAHQNAGHSAEAPSNPVYREWLQQQVGSDGQLHLPPPGSPGVNPNAPGGSATTTTTTQPASPAPAPAAAGSNSQPNGTLGNIHIDIPPIDPSKLPGNIGDSLNNSGPLPQNPGSTVSPSDIQPIPNDPVGSTREQALAASTSSVAGGQDALKTSSTAAAGGSYVVNHGDTMSGIAEQHGMSLSHLESLNPQIKDPNLIYAGQTVNLGETKAQGSTDMGGATTASAFPTSSTYPPTDSKSEVTTAAVDKAKHGWASEAGNTTPDPAQTATFVDAHQNTDPLKINKDKKSA